jgi:superfamily II DNA or RNA helicase
MNRTYLSKRGYVIKKEYYDEAQLDKVKRELFVKPNIKNDFGQEPERFPVYLENSKKLYVPKFYGINKFGIPETDTLPEGDDIDIKFAYSIRENQEVPVSKCIEAYNKTGGGILSLGCGQGKTIIGLYLASFLKKKTLVIVHKEFLLNQWVERIGQALPDAKIGRIQKKVYDVEGKDIVIGMLQTISMKDFPLGAFDCFGHVIIDEAHRIPSQVFSRALQKINAKYMLALSATPNRKDGLTKILKWYVGDVVYSNTENNANDVNVDRYIVKSNNPDYNKEIVNFNGVLNTPRMISNITEYYYRTKIIFKIIKELIKEDGRKILILSDRRDHLKDIYEYISENNVCSIGYYIGGMKEKDLKISEEKDVILGTFAMANEGLDIEALNTLILASPKSDVIQATGRILRKSHANITPTIVDIIDNFASFERQAMKRLKFYRSKDYTIKHYEVQDVSGEILSEKEDYFKEKKKEMIVVNTCLF